MIKRDYVLCLFEKEFSGECLYHANGKCMKTVRVVKDRSRDKHGTMDKWEKKTTDTCPVEKDYKKRLKEDISSRQTSLF